MVARDSLEQREYVADTQEGISEQASNLFRYLHALQRLQQVTVRDSARYRNRGGLVAYLHALNAGRAVTLAAPDDRMPLDAPVITVHRLQPVDPPALPDEVKLFVDGDPSRADREPLLRFADPEQEPDDASTIRDTFDLWLDDWREWAASEVMEARGRELYAELFSIRDQLAVAPHDWELLLGLGRLQIPARGDKVDRHIIVLPLRIELDSGSGSISLRLADGAEAKAEFDMLNSDELTNHDAASHLEECLRELPVAHPLDQVQWRDILQGFIHAAMPTGEFLDEPTSTGQHPHLALSPAVIFRPRNRSGLLRALNVVANALDSQEEIPPGIRALVDPDSVDVSPAAQTPQDGGAAYNRDGEFYLPLPVNPEQLEVLARADSRPLTVVQGPPGTGKTHTAAVMISHFLSQGKRVLVTAQTQQALREVRDKLPDEIKDLAVSVLGNDRQEMANLRTSINAISQRAQNFSSTENDAAIHAAEEQVSALSRRRADLRNQLIEAGHEECAARETPFGTTRLAEVARQVLSEEADVPWASDVLPEARLDLAAPDAADVMEYVERTARWAASPLVGDAESLPADFEELPEIRPVQQLMDRVEVGRQTREQNSSHHVNPRFTTMLQSRDSIDQVRSTITDLLNSRQSLTARPEGWIQAAIDDIRVGKTRQWTSRYEDVQRKLSEAEALVPTATGQGAIHIGEATVELRPLVATMQAFTSESEIKLDNHGQPKTGLMAARPVKAAKPLFDAVRIDGRPPSTHTDFVAIEAHMRLGEVLNQLDHAWPAGTSITDEDSAAERLAWHTDELAVLRRVLALIDLTQRLQHVYEKRDLGPCDSASDQSLTAAVLQLDVLSQRLEVGAAEASLEDLARGLEDRGEGAPCIYGLAQAIRACDGESFRRAHHFAQEVLGEKANGDRRLALRASLQTSHLRLVEHVDADPSYEKWSARVGELEAAWRLSAARNWMDARQRFDANEAQAEIAQIDARIRQAVSELVGRRSWAHAVDRLTPSRKADLQYYAQLVRSYGRGTGKRAARLQPEIRKALANSRDAVPVWIMPLHQVADSQEIAMNTFDVVVVDEASQAGLESLFLQYLAPKMVIVGDDKQVSPSAVGLAIDEIESMANRFLAGNRYKAAFTDPGRSLFDEAKMRYPDVITLREHRRCVPDIIGFSNEVAYAPDGVSLIPVREPGASALEPVVARFCAEGYMEGTSSTSRNPVEAEAIVETIQSMLEDPRYDGKTIGVISLLGAQQAKLIERMLLAVIEPEQMVAREIRCGDSASFQGAERDVMLLSLVAAPSEGRRLASLTRDAFVQRYNVAASRAKDQMILFYSTPVELLRNEDDMRFRIVEYCERVAAKQGSGIPGAVSQPLPNDRLERPFASLFEQRVCNELVSRGYIVVPQYESLGYRIDLVVVGADGKLAVECDGDAWHGPERFGADLARQRDLERCGWTFYRILESDFILDPRSALEPLFEMLDERGILPGARSPRRPKVEIPSVVAPETSQLSLVEVYPEMEPEGVVVATPQEVPEARVVPIRPVPVEVEQADVVMEEYEEAILSELPKDYISAAQMREALRDVVGAEGPLIGSRLIRVVHKARGHQRLKKPSDQPYLNVLRRMVSQGELLSSGRDPQEATYWLPGQSRLRVRTLGPRGIDEIPPLELASVVARCRSKHPLPDGDDGYVRAVLRSYGLVRMTPKVVRQILEIERTHALEAMSVEQA